MGKLSVGTFVSLDGVYQGPGAPDEDPEDGFEHGGWTASYIDEQVGERIAAATLGPDAVLLGRKTYDIFAAYWPRAGTDDPIAAKLNEVPKFVASRTQPTLEWNNSTLVSGDVPARVTELKDAYDLIGVTGSGDLVQTLLRNNLVDELQLLIFPVMIGSGKRLFGSGTVPGAFSLVDSMTSPSGVAIHTYRPAGDIQYGDVV